MITRLGNVELTRLLNIIEENFWKIFYNLERISADFEHNLKVLYEHFYNLGSYLILARKAKICLGRLASSLAFSFSSASSVTY
jgi:hypothetical protein